MADRLFNWLKGLPFFGKVAVFIAAWLIPSILLLLIFGSDGKNEEFKPQNEFKLEPTGSRSTSAGIDLQHQQGGPLPGRWRARLTIWTMVWIARRMQHEAEPRPDRDRGRLRPDQEQHHRRQPSTLRDQPLVPVPRRALLLDLVLEHDRLPAAADQQRRAPVDIFGVDVPSFAIYAATGEHLDSRSR